MELTQALVGIAGLLVAPVMHGLLLFLFSGMIHILARGPSGKGTTAPGPYLWGTAELLSAAIGVFLVTSAMGAVGYEAGWGWLLLLSLYFLQNYFWRASKGLFPKFGYTLLICDLLGIWGSGLGVFFPR
jgi:hypothetical protein